MPRPCWRCHQQVPHALAIRFQPPVSNKRTDSLKNRVCTSNRYTNKSKGLCLWGTKSNHAIRISTPHPHFQITAG
jgi:hypothetical protein